ncbi:MAG: hypothetical protein LUF84_01130, partial [Clostridiales bacterium]|nr:hypothetical protein [Clostridiales bacterium]
MENRIKFGQIRPCGWLKRELRESMRGCIGHLDQLVPDLILKDDIYGKDRLGCGSAQKELGRNDPAEPDAQDNDAQ